MNNNHIAINARSFKLIQPCFILLLSYNILAKDGLFNSPGVIMANTTLLAINKPAFLTDINVRKVPCEHHSCLMCVRPGHRSPQAVNPSHSLKIKKKSQKKKKTRERKKIYAFE